MKMGMLKRLSAVLLAAVMAVSLAPVMGTVTSGTAGQVEAKAETIRVTAETVRQYKQNVELFRAGYLPGEGLFEEVTAIIDDDEILSVLNDRYESYTASEQQLKDVLYEYCDYLVQTAKYYDQVLQQQQITSLIKLIKSLYINQSVTLSVSSSSVEIRISVEELKAYGNQLRGLTDGLEQGHPAEEIQILFDSHIGWFEEDEIHPVIEERFAQYIADRDAFAQVLQEILDWYCYLLQQSETDEGIPPFIVTENPVDYGLDIPERMQVIDPESGETKSATKWDCIWFGDYPQSDSWGYEKDPIKWRVLWVDGDNAFLLADKNLDMKQYNGGNDVPTINWSTCSLRAWLNEDFYNTAFDEDEQNAVRTTIVNNENNPEYGTYGGGATFDKVYLLSVSEARNLNYGFPNIDDNKLKDELKVENTAYTNSKNGSSATGSIDWWWLRTIGYGSGYAVRARNSGGIALKGYYTWSTGLAVRPCLHIDLSKDVWSYAGTVCSDGTVEEPASHTRISIEKAKVSSIVDKAYTGEAITQNPTVRLDDNVLAEGTDYEVTYSGNIIVGTATVTITGKGDYTGKITRTFRVLFTDVLSGHQFFEPIYWAVDNAITIGWDDGTFRPWSTCNRAAVVTFLWRMAGCPEPSTIADFKDMPSDTLANLSFRKAISWAVEEGITTGWDDNTFRPWQTCNRAAVMTFIWRYAGKPTAAKPSGFKDKTGNKDFDAAIAWASEQGITTGYSDGTFGPWKDCNRASIAAFLYRFDSYR